MPGAAGRRGTVPAARTPSERGDPAPRDACRRPWGSWDRSSAARTAEGGCLLVIGRIPVVEHGLGVVGGIAVAEHRLGVVRWIAVGHDSAVVGGVTVGEDSVVARV